MKIEIYTDGSCNQETHNGGWAFLVLENDKIKIEKSNEELSTTNNKCEMLAAINSFEELDKLKFIEPINVFLYSDSAYLVNAFNHDWISTWLINGWKNSSNEPVANKEYWEKLIFFQKKYKTNFVQIKRRSNPYAKKVDDMARNPLNFKSVLQKVPKV